MMVYVPYICAPRKNFPHLCPIVFIYLGGGWRQRDRRSLASPRWTFQIKDMDDLDLHIPCEEFLKPFYSCNKWECMPYLAVHSKSPSILSACPWPDDKKSRLLLYPISKTILFFFHPHGLPVDPYPLTVIEQNSHTNINELLGHYWAPSWSTSMWTNLTCNCCWA